MVAGVKQGQGMSTVLGTKRHTRKTDAISKMNDLRSYRDESGIVGKSAYLQFKPIGQTNIVAIHDGYVVTIQILHCLISTSEWPGDRTALQADARIALS
jgi:hypothetical protein